MKRLLEDLQDQRWLGVVAVITVLCTSGALVAIALASGLLPVGSSDPSATPEMAVSATQEPLSALATPSPTAEAQPTERGLPLEVELEMAELEEQVSQLRGLVQLEVVERRLVHSEQFPQIVESELLVDYNEAEAESDRILYSLLELIPADFDFYQTYLDLYTEQVAGYYDHEAEAMVVVRDTDFEGPERLTYVHEFVHALQDQHFPFDETLAYTHEVCEQTQEACGAVQALIEGDATLLEEQWLRTFASDADIDELNAFFDDYSSPAFDAAPGFIQDMFLFPYLYGREFVLWHYRDGSWGEIDDMYSDPPRSTEQILHPERYPQDQPIEFSLPEAVAEGMAPEWSLLDQGTFGEYELRLILGAHLDEGTAQRAAAGWGGCTYSLLQRNNQPMLIVVGQWDTIRDAQEAWLALREYGENRFSGRETRATQEVWQAGGITMTLEHASDQVLWMLAPDESSASAARSFIQFPLDLR